MVAAVSPLAFMRRARAAWSALSLAGRPNLRTATPAVLGPNGQGPVCVVAANSPAPGTFIQGATAQGTSVQVTPGTTWQQVATLQGPVASNLGLPAGQTMNVFCAPTGSQNPQGQPTGYQPGQTNLGQTNPAQAPLQNPTGPQNPAPGQQ